MVAPSQEDAREIIRRIAADLDALARTETRGRLAVETETGHALVVWSAESLPVFDRLVLRIVVRP